MSSEEGVLLPGAVPYPALDMADSEGQREAQAVRQTAPEVEIVIDASPSKLKTTGENKETAETKKGSFVDGSSDEREKKELLVGEETDGASIPAKYAEAVLAVDTEQG